VLLPSKYSQVYFSSLFWIDLYIVYTTSESKLHLLTEESTEGATYSFPYQSYRFCNFRLFAKVIKYISCKLILHFKNRIIYILSNRASSVFYFFYWKLKFSDIQTLLRFGQHCQRSQKEDFDENQRMYRNVGER